jgi:hypothetical protein
MAYIGTTFFVFLNEHHFGHAPLESKYFYVGVGSATRKARVYRDCATEVQLSYSPILDSLLSHNASLMQGESE